MPNEDEIFVEAVEERSVIYDSSHHKHKNYNFINTIWNEISSLVGKSCKYTCIIHKNI